MRQPRVAASTRRGEVVRSARPSQSGLAKKKAAKRTKSGSSGSAQDDRAASRDTRSKAAPARARTRTAPAGERRPLAGAALSTLDAALARLARKEWRPALEQLNAILVQHPEETGLLDRVRMYARVCEQQLAAPPAAPATAEERYQLGIIRLNQGELDEALELLRAAERESGDKATYALAAVHALRGERDASLGQLRRAIDANPDNRIHAANDSDFEALRTDPEFAELTRAASAAAAAAPAAAAPAAAPSDEAE